MNPHTDFQKVLNNFNGFLKFVRLVNTIQIQLDTVLYMLETLEGTYFLYETEEIPDKKAILVDVKKYVGEEPEFIEVIFPPKKLEDIETSKYYLPGKYSYDFESVRKYINDKDNSASYMVSYLIKSTHFE